MMHCKSGADRAGLMSALYLLIVEKRPAREAAQQLAWKYGHVRQAKTGLWTPLRPISPMKIREWPFMTGSIMSMTQMTSPGHSGQRMGGTSDRQHPAPRIAAKGNGVSRPATVDGRGAHTTRLLPTECHAFRVRQSCHLP